MPNWTEINERRIGEKTQEVKNYCAQRRDSMTPRAFERARISLAYLLDNLMERNPAYSGIPETVKNSMNKNIDTVAECSDEQALSLARTIVYNAVGDDIRLYPVTALQKIQKSRARGEQVNIPADEMTARDFLTVARAITEGVEISQETTLSVFKKFNDEGFDPYMTRVYGYVAFSTKSFNIKSVPGFSTFGSEYRKAAESLTKLGFFVKNQDGQYQITDMKLNLE